MKEIPSSRTERFSIVNMAVLLKLVYRFSEISIKIPPGVCVETDKWSLKFMQRIQNSYHNFEKQENGRMFSFQFQIYYKLQ